MEDENGLELSLGLSFGGSSVKPKSKNGISLDTRADEVGRGGKMDDDFKNFFNAGNQRTDPSKPEENFFNDLSKAKEDNASANLDGRGIWFADNNKNGEVEEDKRLEFGSKRKMVFGELNHQKKHEIEAHHADLHDRARTPHISLFEDGSNAENKDVADSKAENSTSRPFSLNEDGFKQLMRVGSSSVLPKEVCKVADSSASATDLNEQKRFIGSSEKDFKLADLTHASFPIQEVNLVNTPCPQIPGKVHAMQMATGESAGAQHASNGNLPVFHPQQLHLSFAGRGPPNAAPKHASSKTLSVEGRPSEQTKGSAQADDVRGSSTNLREKDGTDRSKEGFSFDVPAIKPGLAADVKFGGFGSCPNLPWVSVTGLNGTTISGVTYRYINNQIRIVCACHGSHMSREDFIRHANEDAASSDGGAAVANGNPSASPHS